MDTHRLIDFPVEKLVLSKGTIQPYLWSFDPLKIYYKIELNSAPIVISSDLEVFDKVIGGEFLELDVRNFHELVRRKFSFPDNPEDGFIDAAIYYQNVHHPVYIRSISFQQILNNQIKARIEFQIQFEYEGSTFRDTAFIIKDTVIEFGNLVISKDDVSAEDSISSINKKLKEKIDIDQFERPYWNDNKIVQNSNEQSVKSSELIYKIKDSFPIFE